MKKHRIMVLLIFSVLLSFAAAAAAAANCRAEAIPDLSHLDKSYLLSDNRQILTLSDGTYAVISTDSSQYTYAAFIDMKGNLLDDSDAVVFLFPYQKATVCGNYLYVAGNSIASGNTVEIHRVNLTDKTRIKNQIFNVECNFSRGFYATSKGILYLATHSENDDSSHSGIFSAYQFSDKQNAVLIGAPAPEFSPDLPESSSSNLSSDHSKDSPASSESSLPSSTSEQSSSESSSVASSEPSTAAEYRFSAPVTVNELQKQLNAEGRGAQVRVTSLHGNEVTDGSIGTGSVIEVLLDGRVDSRATAVIPGDLTGSGIITQKDFSLLWEYCVGHQNLEGLFWDAADIDQNGKVDTSDMLKLKMMFSKS